MKAKKCFEDQNQEKNEHEVIQLSKLSRNILK